MASQIHTTHSTLRFVLIRFRANKCLGHLVLIENKLQLKQSFVSASTWLLVRTVLDPEFKSIAFTPQTLTYIKFDKIFKALIKLLSNNFVAFEKQ